MAKYVIAGISDCPKFANIDLLADKVTKSLPGVEITKIVKARQDWPSFLDWVNTKHGWTWNFNTLVWRELVDHGGKGVLIGDHNAFQELIKSYYNIASELKSDHLLLAAKDNKEFTEFRSKQQTLIENIANDCTKVAIVGANWAGLISFLTLLSLEGIDQLSIAYEVTVYTEECDYEEVSELQDLSLDLASKLLRRIKLTKNLEEAVSHAKFIIINDLLPFIDLDPDSEKRNSWLKERRKLYNTVGHAIKRLCSSTCKIFLPAQSICRENVTYTTPVNLDVYFLTETLKDSSNPNPTNVIGIPKIYENKAKADLARSLNISTYQIYNLLIWGYIGRASFTDYTMTKIRGLRSDSIGNEDPEWHDQSLAHVTWKPGLTEQKSYRPSGPDEQSSEAIALVNSMQDVINGPQNDSEILTSLVVPSRGDYEVPEGIPFSFPMVNRPKGCLRVFDSIALDDAKSRQIENEVKLIQEDLINSGVTEIQ